MLRQSTPILARAKRAYLTYVEKLSQLPMSAFEENSLDVDIELEETLYMVNLIDVELKKRLI